MRHGKGLIYGVEAMPCVTTTSNVYKHGCHRSLTIFARRAGMRACLLARHWPASSIRSAYVCVCVHMRPCLHIRSGCLAHAKHAVRQATFRSHSCPTTPTNLSLFGGCVAMRSRPEGEAETLPEGVSLNPVSSEGVPPKVGAEPSSPGESSAYPSDAAPIAIAASSASAALMGPLGDGGVASGNP